MNKKNKQAKKVLVGAIITMIMQSIPLNIFANEEDNKTIESKLGTPKEDVEKKDEKTESTKLDTDINPDSDINKDYTKQNGEKNEKLNKVQPKQERDSEIKEKTIVQEKNSDVINIQDVNLENKLRTILKLSADQPITKGDLLKINYLSLQDNRIKNISGLEYCTNLKTLDLSNINILNNHMSNQVSDISPLKNLNISNLNLKYQKIQLKEVDSKNNIAEVENSIKNRDGSSVNVVNISNGGIYNPDTNSIKWDNITSDINETYDFSGNLPNSYSKFSGKSYTAN